MKAYEAILEAVLLLEGPVLLDEGVDPVDHLLDELDLAVAEAVLVRDVVRHARLTARLPPGSYHRPDIIETGDPARHADQVAWG